MKNLTYLDSFIEEMREAGKTIGPRYPRKGAVRIEDPLAEAKARLLNAVPRAGDRFNYMAPIGGVGGRTVGQGGLLGFNPPIGERSLALRGGGMPPGYEREELERQAQAKRFGTEYFRLPELLSDELPQGFNPPPVHSFIEEAARQEAERQMTRKFWEEKAKLPESKPGEPLPSLTWVNKVYEIGDNPVKLLPFLGSGVEIYKLGKLLVSAQALQEGKEISEEDLLALEEYVARSERDSDWGYKVADVIANMIPYGLEMLFTFGIYSAGKTATIKGGEKALQWLATKAGAKFLTGKVAQYGLKAAGVLVGGTLQTIPAGITQIPASTVEKQLTATLSGDEEEVWRSAVEALGERWVETVSESAGELIKPLTDVAKGKLLKIGLFRALSKVNPGKSGEAISEFLEKAHFHGILPEMGEERIAEAGHGLLEKLGLGGQKYRLPSLEQLSIEMAAFAVPSVAGAALGRVDTTRLAAGAKELATNERGSLKKPADILKTLPTVTETNTYTALQQKATSVGLSVEAVQGIAPGEYWVAITHDRKAEPFDIVDKWQAKLPEANQRKAGHLFLSDIPFVPFKNITDAAKFIETGDTSLIAKTVNLKGEAWTPEQLAEARKQVVEDAARRQKLAATYPEVETTRDLITQKETELSVLTAEDKKIAAIPIGTKESYEKAEKIGVQQGKLNLEIYRLKNKLKELMFASTLKAETALISPAREPVRKKVPAPHGVAGVEPSVVIYQGSWTAPENIMTLASKEQAEKMVKTLNREIRGTREVRWGVATEKESQDYIAKLVSPTVQQPAVPAKEVTKPTEPAIRDEVIASLGGVEGTKAKIAELEASLTRPRISVKTKMSNRIYITQLKQRLEAVSAPAPVPAVERPAIAPESATVVSEAQMGTVPPAEGVTPQPAEVIPPVQPVIPPTAEAAPPVTEAGTPPVPPVPPVPPIDLILPDPDEPGRLKLTQEQIDSRLKAFGDALVSPNTVNIRMAVEALRKLEFAKRLTAQLAEERRLIELGVSRPEAYEKSKEMLKGEMPNAATGLKTLTDALVDVIFAKIDSVWSEAQPNYATERIAAKDAFNKYILGEKTIPMKPGTGTGAGTVFEAGGDAYKRLAYVFGVESPLLKKLTVIAKENESAEQKKGLTDIVEGVFHDVLEGGLPPIDIDQEIAEYLRKLSTFGSQQTTGMVPEGELRGLLTYEPTGLLGLEQQGQQAELGQAPYVPPESVTDRLTDFERQLRKVEVSYEISIPPHLRELRKSERLERPGPLQRLSLRSYLTKLVRQAKLTSKEANTILEGAERVSEGGLEMPTLMPAAHQSIVIECLKEAGLTAIDIGSALKAILASYDQSFGRQMSAFIVLNPTAYYKAWFASWTATFSQKAADAEWASIANDPVTKYVNESGQDLLILPGEQTEEYGYLNPERAISKGVLKIPGIKYSQRGFTAGTNRMKIEILRKELNRQLRDSEKVASGELKLKPGEVFSIRENMNREIYAMKNMTMRGYIGGVGKAAKLLNIMGFSPRARWGSFLTVKSLISDNKYERRLAWSNVAATIGFWTSVMLLGKLIGLWDIETDTRSSDFAKVRVGNTRFNPLGHWQQFTVLAARLLTGKAVSSTTGEEFEMGGELALLHYLRGGYSPLAGLISDLWEGRTFTGEKTNLLDKEQWLDRLLPMAIGDIRDAFAENDTAGLATALAAIPLAIHGMGVQTYAGDFRPAIAKLGTEDSDAKNKALKDALTQNVSARKYLEILNKDYTFTTSDLGTVLRRETNKIKGKGDYKEHTELIAYYWDTVKQTARYEGLSADEQPGYLEENPDFALARLFWGRTTSALEDDREELRTLAKQYKVPENAIPALQEKEEETRPGKIKRPGALSIPSR